jgi:hypothetical protein
VLGLSKTGSTVSIRCLVEPGKTYRLMAKDSLGATDWTPVTDAAADNNWVMAVLDVNAGTGRRFYRLEELP